MPEWLRILISVVTSEEVMRAVVIVGVGYLGQITQRDKKDRLLAEITVDIVDFIEEHYAEWGIRGPAKLERFLTLFTEEFDRVIGRPPSSRELQTAKLKAEAHVQRARRGDYRSLVGSGADGANGTNGLNGANGGNGMNGSNGSNGETRLAMAGPNNTKLSAVR